MAIIEPRRFAKRVNDIFMDSLFLYLCCCIVSFIEKELSEEKLSRKYYCEDLLKYKIIEINVTYSSFCSNIAAVSIFPSVGSITRWIDLGAEGTGLGTGFFCSRLNSLLF